MTGQVEEEVGKEDEEEKQVKQSLFLRTAIIYSTYVCMYVCMYVCIYKLYFPTVKPGYKIISPRSSYSIFGSFYRVLDWLLFGG